MTMEIRTIMELRRTSSELRLFCDADKNQNNNGHTDDNGT
jgi:hypothetical protein